MKITDIITINREIQSGAPVFKGARVPVQTLFRHLESGVSINEFLEDFPSAIKEQAVQLLQLSNKIISTPLTVFVLAARGNTYQILSELIPNIKTEPKKPLVTGALKIQK